jgi:brefeldin A-inhibited guanine nucleotide-exchange protein
VGLFFTNIIIVTLENANSTILQRWLVIQTLEKIFKNPQTLVDIFVNFDCDLKEKNIFER